MTRIAIAGAGLVTPLGLSLQQNWDRTLRGESAIGPCRRLDLSGHRCRASATVAGFDLTPLLRTPKNQKFMSPAVRYLIRAAHEAVEESGLDFGVLPAERIAVHVASGQVGPEPSEFFGAFDAVGEPDYARLGGPASRSIDPYFPLRSLSNAGAGLLAMELGARGPSSNHVQSDTAALMAIETACEDLRDGLCDVALAGGSECLVTVSSYLAYENAGLLSGSPPEEACRPFDHDADGVVLGEGAGVLVLERREDAVRRGAPVRAEIAGFGSSMDHSAIRQALCGEHADFVIAHGLGLPDADAAEAASLASIPGDPRPVTALKSHTGYLGAATGAVEAILAVQSLVTGLAPPIARHRRKRAGIELDLVTGEPRRLRGNPRHALLVTRSWTGACAAILLRSRVAAG